LAFGLDAAVLGLVWYALWVLARPVLQAIGHYALPVQFAYGFLYFAILDGPLVGQTVGKAAMNVRVVRAADLAPLGHGAAIARAAMKLAPFALMAAASYGTSLAPLSLPLASAMKVVSQAGMGLVLASVAHMLLSTRGQALYDLPLGAITGRDPVGDSLLAWLGSGEVATLDKQTKPLQTAMLIFAVTMLMSSCHIAETRRLWAQPGALEIAGYRLANMDIAEVDGVKPDIFLVEDAKGSDGITSMGLVMRYWVPNSFDTATYLASSEEAARRLESRMLEVPEMTLRGYLNGREDAQIRTIFIRIVEFSAFLNVPFSELRTSQAISVAIPVESLLKPVTSTAAPEATAGATAVEDDPTTPPAP